MLLHMGPEPQLVDQVDDLAEVVSALDLVLQLREYLTDLILDGIRTLGLSLEFLEVREQLESNINREVIIRPLKSFISLLSF